MDYYVFIIQKMVIPSTIQSRKAPEFQQSGTDSDINRINLCSMHNLEVDLKLMFRICEKYKKPTQLI